MNEFIKQDVTVPESDTFEAWFTKQLKEHGRYLLAFADDGVIWGHPTRKSWFFREILPDCAKRHFNKPLCLARKVRCAFSRTN